MTYALASNVALCFDLSLLLNEYIIIFLPHMCEICHKQ